MPGYSPPHVALKDHQDTPPWLEARREIQRSRGSPTSKPLSPAASPHPPRATPAPAPAGVVELDEPVEEEGVVEEGKKPQVQVQVAKSPSTSATLRASTLFTKSLRLDGEKNYLLRISKVDTEAAGAALLVTAFEPMEQVGSMMTGPRTFRETFQGREREGGAFSRLPVTEGGRENCLSLPS
jgi:hypothetical protein